MVNEEALEKYSLGINGLRNTVDISCDKLRVTSEIY